MGSREKDPTVPHQPLLSSLVIRPTESGGGGGGGSDYEPGEVRRDPPPYSRPDRYDDHGFRMRAGSVSPRHRDARHLFSPNFEYSDGAPQSHGFGNGRDLSRYRDYSPPYGRARNGGRFAGRGYDRPARGLGPVRGEGMQRNNPNVQPREGDWICSDPSCKNLNFARRELCNNCNRPRYASAGSPKRGYPGPPFSSRQRFPGPPPLDHSPGRIINGGYRSPPRGGPRGAAREFRAAGPPPRHEGRFPNLPMRGGRQDYPEDEPPRDRYRTDRDILPDWGHRDHARDNYFTERRGYGRRVLSPPPAAALPPRGWTRERSLSPVRGAAQPKDYQRDPYMNRGRGDRSGVGRDAF